MHNVSENDVTTYTFANVYMALLSHIRPILSNDTASYKQFRAEIKTCITQVRKYEYVYVCKRID